MTLIFLRYGIIVIGLACLLAGLAIVWRWV